MHELGGFERELAVIFRACDDPSARGHPFHCRDPSRSPSKGASRPFFLRRRVVVGIAGEVDVFDPLLRVVPGAGAEIGADVRLGADARNIVEKLMRAEAIVFDGAPSHLEAARTLVARPDAVAPVVVGGKISAGPAQQRDMQIFDSLQNVACENLLCRRGASLLRKCRLRCSGRDVR